MRHVTLAVLLGLVASGFACGQPLPPPPAAPDSAPRLKPNATIPAAPRLGPRASAATEYQPPDLGEWPAARIDPLLRSVDPARLREWHTLLASQPHIAGSAGDVGQVERLAKCFADMGLEVEKHEFWAYLSSPVSTVLELLDGGKATPLVTKEQMLPEDLDSSNPDLTWGWNAFSGTGDVTAPIVYANQGTKADFARLRELGVDCKGKIVLCRYGGNFRGHKVRFAELAGAAAVVIFTDQPPDASTPYPRGGFPNDSCIERGSINTLDYPGDPLTPGIEANKDAPRLDPASIALPKIPVQPIGWGAARAILIAMAERSDPAHPSPVLPDKWQGGINVPYTLVGPDTVRLRVRVEQKRELVRSANVIGTLRGETWPDEWVLIGAHHDAWGFGACDPTCGTITVLEAAKVLADAAKAGKRPRRTVKFCAWGAEEFSIIGSTEWVESRREALEQQAIAYINLDMASMGPNFGASAAPSLKTLIAEVSRHVPDTTSKLAETGIDGQSVYAVWTGRGESSDPLLSGEPRIGNLGGGSDHVAFWCHAGVPSCGLGASGAKGSAYHSVYDTLTWYRKNVGDDYQSARMVTQMAIGVLARLTDDDTPPLDFARDMHDTAVRLRELAELADRTLPAIAPDVRAMAERAREASFRTGVWANALARVPGNLPARRQVWATIRQRILTPKGLPLREWYRNELASPDADSGYSPWFLPRLTRAIENSDIVPARIALERYGDMIGGGPANGKPPSSLPMRERVPGMKPPIPRPLNPDSPTNESPRP
ncbi:MAG: M20/M25/M40 family metallo-hydrolase [Phycisphaerales bacterium]|nr:M20/M25/M40 family metallo-hydrolase [Phycisphaerales bacterium]